MKRSKALVATMVLMLALSVGAMAAAADVVSSGLQLNADSPVVDGPGVVRPMGPEGPDPVIPPWDEWM